MQLSLNFLPTQQPASPLSRLDTEQRAKLVEVLARIITKAAGTAAAPPALPSPTSKEPAHD